MTMNDYFERLRRGISKLIWGLQLEAPIWMFRKHCFHYKIRSKLFKSVQTLPSLNFNESLLQVLVLKF